MKFRHWLWVCSTQNEEENVNEAKKEIEYFEMNLDERALARHSSNRFRDIRRHFYFGFQTLRLFEKVTQGRPEFFFLPITF